MFLLNASDTNCSSSSKSTKYGGFNPLVNQISFGSISVLSIIGNLFVMFVLFKKRNTLLTRSYFILTLILAACDFLTGIFLFIAPRHVFRTPVFEPSSDGFLLTFYCNFIWNKLVIYTLGTISIFLCLTITIDRWVAVVFATKYPIISRWLLCVVAFSEITLLFVLLSLQAPAMNSEAHKPPGERCSYGNTDDSVHTAAIASVFTTVFVPFVVIIILYAHLLYKFKTSVMGSKQQVNAAKKRITIVAATTSITLIVCWLPSQINYLLFNFHKVKLGTPFHDFTTLLAMFNSTVNPLLYGLASQEFRKGYWEVVCSFYQWFHHFKCGCCASPSVGPELVQYTVPIRDNHSNGTILEICVRHIELLQKDEGDRQVSFHNIGTTLEQGSSTTVVGSNERLTTELHAPLESTLD